MNVHTALDFRIGAFPINAYNTVAAVGSLITLATALAGAVALAVPSWRKRLLSNHLVTRWTPHLAWILPLLGIVGSMIYSEAAGFAPCRLCWIQRAIMYPIAPIGIWMAFRGRRWLWVLAVLAFGGLALSSYHYLLQMFPSGGICDPDNPCTLIWVDTFGFVTIPFMVASFFAAIAVTSLTGWWSYRTSTVPSDHI